MPLQPLDESTQKYFDTRGAEPPAPAPEPSAAPEPAPAPAPAVTAEPPAALDGQPRDDKGRYVDYGAMKEERIKRQELQRQLEEMTGRYSTLETRTNEILKRFQQEDEPKPAPVPEWNQDPLGHTKQRLETTEERLARLEREREEQASQTQQQQQYMQFRGHVAQRTSEFMTKTPDYPQAYQYLMEMQGNALQDAGFPPEQIRATLEQYETAIAQKALADGVNPAERAYAMAKRFGYKASAAGPGAANDAARQAVSEQKLQRIAEGQRTSASLSDAAGTAKPQLDAKTLAEMPDDEFAKIWADRKQVRKIVRG